MFAEILLLLRTEEVSMGVLKLNSVSPPISNQETYLNGNCFRSDISSELCLKYSRNIFALLYLLAEFFSSSGTFLYFSRKKNPSFPVHFFFFFSFSTCEVLTAHLTRALSRFAFFSFVIRSWKPSNTKTEKKVKNSN